mmetsp:Transcript_3023/g.9075  ORF Transcript_3023/g.9075 Transcript_3023/m.9075 type:complete len:228 (-) Transcript_3023:2419-3102(-)
MSMRSWMSESCSAHFFARVSNGLMKGEPSIVCALTRWSSSSSWISSIPPMMCVPVSRYSKVMNSSGCQSVCILSRAFSSENSFDAEAEISSRAGSLASRVGVRMEARVVESVGLNGLPTTSETLSQCRSRMPLLQSALISGIFCWNSSIRPLSCSATLSGASGMPSSEKTLMILKLLFHMALTSESSTSGSTSFIEPCIHSNDDFWKSFAVFHSVWYGASIAGTSAS